MYLKNIYFSKILSLVFFGLIICPVEAQSVSNLPTATSWFSLLIEEDMNVPMEIDGSTLNAILFQQPNDEAQSLMLNSFEIVKNKINESKKIELLEINSLKGKVKYSNLGYPIASLKKAAKSKVAQQYVSLTITVAAAKRSDKSQSVGTTVNVLDEQVDVNAGRASSNLFPEVIVDVKFCNAEGEKTGKWRGRYRHDEKIVITSEFLSSEGFVVTVDQNADPIPYYYFLEKAMDDLITKL